MKRWSNEGPDGPRPMTPALQVEIGTDIGQARIRMVYGIVLAALGAGVNVWMYARGIGHLVVVGGALVLALWAFLGGYIRFVRIRQYLDRHGVTLEDVRGSSRD